MSTFDASADPNPQTGRASSARFVDAALDLFVEHGFNGTSLQMIGDRLGVTKAAITYHFKSKDELLAAVVKEPFDDLTRILDDAESVRRESTRRKQGLSAYIDYLIRHRRFTSWLTRDVGAITNPVVWQPAQSLSERIDALLISASPGPLGQVWGAAIAQALSAPVFREIELSDAELGEQLERIGDALIRGFQAASRKAENCGA